MRCSFSTRYLCEVGGKEYFESLMKAFSDNVAEHIAVYGPDNHLRLPGHHETQSSTSSAMASPAASPQSSCRSTSSGTAAKATSKTAAPTPKATPYQIVSRILGHLQACPARSNRC